MELIHSLLGGGALTNGARFRGIGARFRGIASLVRVGFFRGSGRWIDSFVFRVGTETILNSVHGRDGTNDDDVVVDA